MIRRCFRPRSPCFSPSELRTTSAMPWCPSLGQSCNSSVLAFQSGTDLTRVSFSADRASLTSASRRTSSATAKSLSLLQALALLVGLLDACLAPPAALLLRSADLFPGRTRTTLPPAARDPVAATASAASAARKVDTPYRAQAEAAHRASDGARTRTHRRRRASTTRNGRLFRTRTTSATRIRHRARQFTPRLRHSLLPAAAATCEDQASFSLRRSSLEPTRSTARSTRNRPSRAPARQPTLRTTSRSSAASPPALAAVPLDVPTWPPWPLLDDRL